MSEQRCTICGKDLTLYQVVKLREPDGLEYQVHKKCLVFYYGDIFP